MIWDYAVKGILIGLIFGVTVISDFLTAYQHMIQVVGGVFIVLLGISILRKKEKVAAVPETKGNFIFCFVSSFVTAVMNPATILSFMVAFAAFEINGNVGSSEGAGLILGILAGTLGWWLILSGGVSLFRERITNQIYRWLNRILGSFMTVFGIVMVIRGSLGN